jgi:hypothetical protein
MAGEGDYREQHARRIGLAMKKRWAKRKMKAA